jgi:hypothetical protein
MKARKTRWTCGVQTCTTCGHCKQPKTYILNELDLDEWAISLALAESGPTTTPFLEQRSRLDEAIEAATLAG